LCFLNIYKNINIKQEGRRCPGINLLDWVKIDAKLSWDNIASGLTNQRAANELVSQ
jgi:hypothetical protein